MLLLKEIRIAKNITQKQVCDFLDISRPTYSRYENAVHQPTIEIIEKLAEFYNVNVGELFGQHLNQNQISSAPPPIAEPANAVLMPSFPLDAMDIDICECSHNLSDEDKMAVMKYIDFIKKRNNN